MTNQSTGEKPIRILIADDHPIVRQGLAAVLDQEADLEVVAQAANGREAVAKAFELLPDVILMDLQMPEMDGVAAIIEIKNAALETGIIILTTYDTDDYIFRGIEAGARGYLLKDSPPEEVLKAIRAVYQGESLIQPRVASRLLDRLSQLSRNAAPSEGSLSAREVEVLQIMATGAANKEIASRLNIGQSTVKTHIVRIFNKLGVSGRTEAVAEGAKRKIIEL
ncbi:MAG: response regulator transcription factor [Dehalococcoidia bacterium]|jgi:DNA-binding NarL/FixJ family response regulator|nr:response regulator transcription factor [Dehalococcoidia bacterium]MDP7083695.1 response regulator transcription factor [Dehalococcoidia bacterium]MDP7199487.1 response regulator transcription factor [Dehalococcoidia bacterium]MDP7510181.1 response regulator transcription factor [Dehalococcoidia bacterium]HJN88295.1 response regulator transcription factor [Dehalococcoidia bacterium]